MLIPDTRGDLKKVNAFLDEAKLMVGLVHPHIVRFVTNNFVGVSWGALCDLCLLTELIMGGDLRTLLKDYEAKNHPQGFDDDKNCIAFHTDLPALVVAGRDSPRLEVEECAVVGALDAKLTDFGASKEHQDHTMTAGVGTMLWMAPEVMMAECYSEKADVFSFGVLLTELDL